ncbi:hypothetical protein PEBR_14787 [Penicillium brasilianum]|uniref:Uncharacterized protein n=1 Tax=Penicillium brasilianum TaxID=104259 RepID=A0A1S9RRU8_PENBI|nr:hypothetical protein PEBR_14787 [Penicillium brasilianum]
MNTETEMTSLTDATQGDTRDSSLKKPTLDPTKNWKRFWLDTWRFEILAWAFSVGCFVAICILLKVYENKVRPQLAYSLSLNAIISVLATGCKSALFLVVGEAVCQLKWLHFRGPRQQRLSGMQEFDNASRGPLGSINIIVSHQAKSLVCLGAAVIVILLAFEPFMQQVISYPALPVNITDGKAAAKQLYGALVSPAVLRNFTVEQAAQSMWSLSDDFAAAWGQGLWSSDGFEVAAPVCSSGNYCNPSSLNSSSNMTCQMKIPDGAAYTFSVTTTFLDDLALEYISGSQCYLWWDAFPNSSIRLCQSQFFDTGPPSLVNSNVISIKKLTVCGLEDCLRNYNVSTRNGQASIQTGDPEFGMRYNKRRHNLTDPYSVFTYVPTDYDFTSCWIPDNKSKAGFAYCVPWFNSSLHFISQGDYGFLPASDSQTYSYRNGSFRSEYSFEDPFISRIDHLGLEKIMSNVAASLTKLQLEKTNRTFSGTAHNSEVFVKVKWEWMILPGCLVLAGSLFFIATMVVNRKARMPLWKSSALASLYHGLEKQEGDRLVTAISMEVEAENSKVRLMSSDGDGRLVLRRKSLEFDNPPNLPGPDLTPRFGSSSVYGYTRI